MIGFESTVDELVKIARPVRLDVKQTAEGILFYGSFMRMARTYLISIETCLNRTDTALIDLLIQKTYDIKNELLLATCDYVQTPSS